jgi:hypothetical protein
VLNIVSPTSRHDSLISYVVQRKVLIVNMVSDGNCKGKAHPGTGHEVPEGVVMCTSNLSFVSALDGLGIKATPLPFFTPGKIRRFQSCKRLGARQSRSGQVRKTSNMPRFDPRAVQPVASCYSDHASPMTLTTPTITLTVPENSLPTFCI